MKLFTNNWKTLLILFVIFITALVFRFYNLSIIPVGLHVDEINAGYIGRYILLHGKDFIGNSFPLYYDKFGDFRPTGIFYFSGLSTLFFGVNSFAIRFPSALFGALSIFPMYLVGYVTFRKKIIGLFAAGFLAIMPWHIILSRSTSESMVGLFFFLFGLYFMFLFIEKKEMKHFFYSVMSFFIPYFFYHIYRFITPLFFLFFLFTTSVKETKKYIFLGLLFFGIVTLLFAFSNSGSGRFSQVAFYQNPAPLQVLNTIVRDDVGEKIVITRLFHNKGVIYSRELVKQYANYFSFNYLFLEGGLPERYKVPEVGLLSIIWIFLLFIGLGCLIAQPKMRKQLLFLLFFLLIAPVPAALTYEDTPNIQRSALMIVPFVLILSFGLYQITTLKRKAFLIPLLGGFFVISFFEQSYFWHQYMVHTKNYKLYARSEGQRELAFTLYKRKGEFKEVVVPIYQELPALYMFYTNNFSPKDAVSLQRDKKRVVIDGITFVDTSCPSREFNRLGIKEKNILVVDSIECEEDFNDEFGAAGFITTQNGDKVYRLLVR